MYNNLGHPPFLGLHRGFLQKMLLNLSHLGSPRGQHQDGWAPVTCICGSHHKPILSQAWGPSQGSHLVSVLLPPFETNSQFAPENRPGPKRNSHPPTLAFLGGYVGFGRVSCLVQRSCFHLPTIHFQVLSLLASGRVRPYIKGGTLLKFYWKWRWKNFTTMVI